MKWMDIFRARPASHRARLADGTAFPVQRGQTLLEGALQAGLQPPHNCRAGACTTCRCRVVKGRVDSLIDRSYVLTPEDIGEGTFLACQSELRSDVELDWPMPTDAADTQALAQGLVIGQIPLTPRVWRISLALDRELPTQPGQSVNLHLRQGSRSVVRPYSLVHVGRSGEGRTLLDIDVARRDGGVMSGWLTDVAAMDGTLGVETAHGHCVPDATTGPLLAVGAGSGIGAALGVLLHSHRRQPARRTALLAYGTQAHDIYGLDELAHSAHESGAAHVSLAWTQVPPAPGGAGRADPLSRIGRAPAGLRAALEPLTAHNGPPPQVLLFGPPGFVDACVAELAQAGLPPGRIRFDRYQAAAAATPSNSSLRSPECTTI